MSSSCAKFQRTKRIRVYAWVSGFQFNGMSCPNRLLTIRHQCIKSEYVFIIGEAKSVLLSIKPDYK